MDLYTITLLIYNISILPVIFFSILFIFLIVVNLLIKKKKENYKIKKFPFVTVQIPTYNDPIAVRCIEKCIDFDYPKDKYEIMIVDDSTNIETQLKLEKFSIDFPNFIKYIHRKNRDGYKPGALKNSMKYANGEILVLFDADWIPNKDFLKQIVAPFSDPKIAIVQTKQGFYNKDKNWITRFAAYTLMIYHEIIMPIHNKVNSVFFCGTAGAIRRSAFEEVGGWNTKSITEDSELTVKLLKKGYKTKYLPIETPSEVPETIEGFVKQQMRWCYGNARVFIDNFSDIWLKKGLSLKQRLMITYVTFGNVIAIAVILMTVFGMLGWFVGEPRLFSLSEFWNMLSKFGYTAGFLTLGLFTFAKRKMLIEIRFLFYTVFSIGIILAIANSYALIMALFNKKLTWYCTPKKDNSVIVE
jgi:cellulose synthase/poly-beta-1,6-N-acetylglucosamine synthase-like glycosyltransferase